MKELQSAIDANAYDAGYPDYARDCMSSAALG